MVETRVMRGRREQKEERGKWRRKKRGKKAGKTMVQRLSTPGSWNDTLKGLYNFLSSFFKFQSFDVVQVVIPASIFSFSLVSSPLVNRSPFPPYFFFLHRDFFPNVSFLFEDQRDSSQMGSSFLTVKYKSKLNPNNKYLFC